MQSKDTFYVAFESVKQGFSVDYGLPIKKVRGSTRSLFKIERVVQDKIPGAPGPFPQTRLRLYHVIDFGAAVQNSIQELNFYRTLDIVPRCRSCLNRDDEYDAYYREQFSKVLRSGVPCTSDEDEFCDR